MKMVFPLEQDIFIGMAYFRTGNFDAANGWQYSTEHGRYIASISTNVPRASWYFGRRGTLVAFRQRFTRLVRRYLQTGDVKKAKPTGRTSTLTEDVVENVRGRMEQNPRKSVRKLSLQTGCKTHASKVLCWARLMQGLIILTIKNPLIPFPYFSGLSYGSCLTILKKKLKFHPYKFSRI
jgi:hypothetical protein